jgi:hypothetical protein
MIARKGLPALVTAAAFSLAMYLCNRRLVDTDPELEDFAMNPALPCG